jgi:hypothetical protein
MKIVVCIFNTLTDLFPKTNLHQSIIFNLQWELDEL